MTTRVATEHEEWVIWNGLLGVLDMVSIGEIEIGEDGSRSAHLRAPYEMVGPFNLDELEARRSIAFAACVVMSLQHWREQQAELRQDARAKRRERAARRRAAQARFAEEHEAHGHDEDRRRGALSLLEQRQYRELLRLPSEGALRPSEINSAFRRLAKSAHPDAGGGHEEFVRLTRARDALLDISC